MKSFIQGIKNLIKWFPIIWKDRDYDYSFTLLLFKKKIKSQRDFLDKFSHEDRTSLNSKLVIIDKILELFEKLEGDDYTKPYDANFVSKWGKTKHDFVKIPNSENFQCKITYENALTEEDNNIATKEYSDIILKSIEDQKNDKELLFNLIKDNFEGWWE